MARIALVTVGFYSHLQATIRLARVLTRQGHDLIMWGPESCRAEVERLGARWRLHDARPPRANGYALAAGLAAITERFAAELIVELNADDVDLVVRDSQTPWALVAAEYLGIPRLVSHPMFPVNAAPPSSSAKAEAGAVDPDQDLSRKAFESNWLSIARRWGVEIQDVSGVFHNTLEPTMAFTTEKIAGNHARGANWHWIGPLLPPSKPLVPANARALVYACFGTAYNFRKDLFRAVIDGLGGQELDVVISTGGGPASPASLEPLPPNIEVREFVDARDVLARASVHITHGGCNSVHESLMAGVPMVCLPQGFDQFPLSRRIQQLGAGLMVDENPARIRDAALSLCRNQERRACARSLAEHLTQYDGESRVGAVIEQTLAEHSADTG